MDLKFTDEQRMLRETSRDLCAASCGVDVVRKMENDPLGVPEPLWQNMKDMGLLGILLPQDLGGMGLNMLDCAVIYEEFGRALVPARISTAVTACRAATRRGCRAAEGIPAGHRQRRAHHGARVARAGWRLRRRSSRRAPVAVACRA